MILALPNILGFKTSSYLPSLSVTYVGNLLSGNWLIKN
ncbi:hypothetical protein COO91_06097 [Nostoc flagelliforme CCNUN1]|uniref:Uncharacterized protein n=1 Tax=Nostoc flagelliforme CCNUN1 TaxID=2038116 RepID=A0A2K8SXD6_9NOSO|nr:hypothetical protein COO91_06097 [Nostoc flagelliforme CCNUN1]